jgi:hypothetical protein
MIINFLICKDKIKNIKINYFPLKIILKILTHPQTRFDTFRFQSGFLSIIR